MVRDALIAMVLVSAGLTVSGCGTASSPPCFPASVLVIRGPDGHVRSHAALYGKEQQSSSGPVTITLTQGPFWYREANFECQYNWDVLPSDGQVDRYAIRASAINGPTTNRTVEFDGNPVVVLEHDGYRLTIEPQEP